eukprot:2871128-Rhodomonas_salina.3
MLPEHKNVRNRLCEVAFPLSYCAFAMRRLVLTCIACRFSGTKLQENAGFCGRRELESPGQLMYTSKSNISNLFPDAKHTKISIACGSISPASTIAPQCLVLTLRPVIQFCSLHRLAGHVNVVPSCYLPA